MATNFRCGFDYRCEASWPSMGLFSAVNEIIFLNGRRGIKTYRPSTRAIASIRSGIMAKTAVKQVPCFIMLMVFARRPILWVRATLGRAGRPKLKFAMEPELVFLLLPAS